MEFLDTGRGHRLAFSRHLPQPAEKPRAGLLWLGGFRSDMTGTKAVALHEHAVRTGRPYVRFDYSGHGVSDGRFEDGTLSAWLADADQVFRKLTKGRVVLVGSSMGGHIALLMYRALEPALRERIAGLLLIAPAADFTQALMWDAFSDAAKASIIERGEWRRPSEYGDPYPITKALIEDGRRHLLLDDGLDVDCPVHILQGEDDPDVPWQHALKLYRALGGDDVRFTLIKGGDHRLSTPRDIATILTAAEELCLSTDRRSA